MDAVSLRVIYLIVNIFSCYTLYMLLNVFLGKTRGDTRYILRDYFFYYCVDVVMYFYVGVAAFIFVAKVVSVGFLTHRYSGAIVKKTLAVFYVCLLLAGIETIVVFLTGYVSFSLFQPSQYDSYVGTVGTPLLLYMVMLMLRQFDGIHVREDLPSSYRLYWFCILLVPISGIVLVYSMLHWGNMPIMIITLNITLILAVNFFLFYLYDGLLKLMKTESTQDLLALENIYFRDQIETMSVSMQSLSVTKHEMKNQLAALWGMVSEGKNKEATRYMDEIMCGIESSGRIFTGRADIDGLLNFKVEEARQNQIEIITEVAIPETLAVKEFDIIQILGNLLDNAITATQDCKDNPLIIFQMRYRPGRLLIKVTNSYAHTLRYNDKGELMTTYPDEKNHGQGISLIQKAAKNYEGELFLDADNGKFIASVMLYIPGK